MRKYRDAIRETLRLEKAEKLYRVRKVLSCTRDRETPAAARAEMPPQRQPSLYSHGHMGTIQSFKAGGAVDYESEVERSFFRIMEWDYTVDFFVAQPCSVPIQLPSEKLGRYTPDCMVISSPLFVREGEKYKPTVYEIKQQADLGNELRAMRPRLRTAIGFLRDAGFRFKLLTDSKINETFLANITFLLEFRGTRFMYRMREEGDIVQAIMDAVYEVQDGFNPEYILSKLEGNFPRENVIPWIWNLYADYVFHCDLLKPLTLRTLSWQSGDAADDMGNFGMPDYKADWRQPENDWRR